MLGPGYWGFGVKDFRVLGGMSPGFVVWVRLSIEMAECENDGDGDGDAYLHREALVPNQFTHARICPQNP